MCCKNLYLEEEPPERDRCNIFVNGDKIMVRSIKHLDLSDLACKELPDYEISYCVITISPAQAGSLVKQLLTALRQVETNAAPTVKFPH